MSESFSPSAASEPCAICGESTAPGTTLFSDRRTLGSGRYVCALCNASAAAAHGGRPLTTQELDHLVKNGSMAAIAWGNNHI